MLRTPLTLQEGVPQVVFDDESEFSSPVAPSGREPWQLGQIWSMRIDQGRKINDL